MDDAKLHVLTLFAEALEAGSPAAQAAYLDRVCSGDCDLRARLEALLQAHQEAGAFLGGDAAGPEGGITLAEPVLREGAGTVIGKYKLVQTLGEGGMGTVFMAQQTEPVKRLVALKVIKAGMDSGQVLARFEAERQALALMEHPNIAHVLDAGATVGGRPYFVMELVKGVPITRYCDEHQLTPRQRLELFLPVCQALQHAHQKGIIHRDVKPSNVLVAQYDGRPVPKVIDFGIAKTTGPQLTERTLVTGFGSVVGTLEYMSPEQAELNQLDVDTRSDIYSLGVVLYELLTGTTPLDRKRLKGAALLEVLRLIREEEPPKPSTRLSTTEGLPAVAANRGLEPRKLSGVVRGELDWVVMKALEKDRNRRYETANAFALDLQRYLNDEAVLACPPSAWYRLRKFGRRNRGSVLAASLLLLALLGGIVGTTLGLLDARASAEAERLAKLEAVAKQTLAEKSAETERQALRETRQQLANSKVLLAQASYQNNDVPGALEQLDQVPTEPEQLRRWEWHYLRRQFEGGIFSLDGHTDAVTGVAFSPDGTRLATASLDKTARLWDAQTGTPLLQLKGHTDAVCGVAFSLDGTRLATTSRDKTARLWDARTGNLLLELKGHTDEVYGVAFSPDGTRLATTSRDKTARLWDAHTGRPLLELKGHLLEVWHVVFSPDGTRLATGGDKTARVWDVRTGTCLLVLKGHPGDVFRVGFSPDGTHLTSWGEVGFSPDGTRLKPGSELWEVIVWDLVTGLPIPGAIPADLTDHSHTADNRWVAVPRGNVVRLVDLTSPLDPDELAYRQWATRPDPDYHAAEAERLARGGQWFAAAFHLGRLLRHFPWDAPLHVRRAEALAHLGLTTEASTHLLHALFLNPHVRLGRGN